MNSTGVRMIMVTSLGTKSVLRRKSTVLCARGIPIVRPSRNKKTINFILLLMCLDNFLNKSEISGSIKGSDSIHSSSQRWDGVESMNDLPADFSLFNLWITNPVIHIDGRESATAFHIWSSP